LDVLAGERHGEELLNRRAEDVKTLYTAEAVVEGGREVR
jgi:hypothetical protein